MDTNVGNVFAIVKTKLCIIHLLTITANITIAIQNNLFIFFVEKNSVTKPIIAL